MKELLPCPFCGGKATLDCVGETDLSYHVSRAYVECFDCEAISEIAETTNDFTKEGSEKCMQKAIDNWNRRIKT